MNSKIDGDMFESYQYSEIFGEANESYIYIQMYNIERFNWKTGLLEIKYYGYNFQLNDEGNELGYFTLIEVVKEGGNIFGTEIT